MAKKKQTGQDLLDQYKQETGYGLSRQASNESTNGQALLNDYLRNGGGQNVRNGPFNPGYRTGTRPMSQEEYTAAYEKYRKIADVQQAGYRRQQRLLGDTSNRDVDNDILTSRQREQEGLFKRYQQAMAALEGRERQTRRIMDTGDEFGAEPNQQAQTLRQGWKSAEQRAREAEAYAASQPNVRQDQLRGMRRTSEELDRQIDQLTAAQADLYTRGYYFDDDGTAWYYDADGNRVDARTVMATRERINALEKQRQPLSGMISDAETAAEFESRKDEIAALAYSQGEWTQEQRDEAKAILESQRGAGGLLGTSMDVYAFGPYMEALRRGDTASASEWESIYNMLYARLYPGQTAIAGGFAQGIGLTSTAQVMGKALGVDENPAWAAYQRAYQRAQAERPVLAAGANIAGSVALMSGISQGIGAASSAALGARAASMSAGAKTALSMGQSALTFMVKDAIQGAGSVAMGEKSGGAYVQDILASGAGGAAGTLVSGLIATNMADWLRRTGNMTPFWEFVRQSVSAFGSSSTNIATSTLLGSEKKSGQQIATELGTAFLFSLVNGYIGTMRETRTASRAVEQKYEQMEQQLAALGKHFSGKTYSSEAEFEQAVNDLRQTVQGLKAEVQGTYYAGQQGFTDQLVSALDRMDYNLLSMLDTGLSGGADAAAAATAAGGMPTAEAQELLTDAADALSGGASQSAGPNPTQPAPDAATARPQATEMPTGEYTTPMPGQPAQTGVGGAAKAAEEAFTLYNRAADERDRLEQARRSAAAPKAEAQQEPPIAEGGSAYERGQQTDNVSDGGPERVSGQRTGEPTGAVAGGAGGGAKRNAAAQQTRAAAQRQNYARDLRLPKISTRDLGLTAGTDARTNTVFTREHWDAGMRSTAARVKEKTGLETTYVLGALQIHNSKGGVSRAAGVFMGDRIIVQADNLRASIDQLADHEMYHYLAKSTPELNYQVEEAIRSAYSEEEFEKVVEKYIISRRGVNDIPEDGTEEAVQSALNAIKEEIFADAYAGINAFGAHAEQFRQAAQDTAEARGAGRTKEAETTRGPPDRYSIERTTENQPFVEVAHDILDGVPREQWVSTVKDNLKKKFPNGITVGNNDIRIDKQSRQEMTFSRYMRWLYNNDPQMHTDKLRATGNADEILRATTDWVNEGLNHPRKDQIADFARGNVLLRVGRNDYSADVVVGTRKDGTMLMYDVLNLQKTAFTKKEMDAAIAANPSPGTDRNTASVSETSIRSPEAESQEKFSVLESGEEQEDKRKSERITMPTTAKRELQQDLFEMFSIPKQEQADAGRIIDYFAERVYRSGELTQADRDVFLARLYSAGAMDAGRDERYGAAPDIVGDGHIYVSDGVQRAFGRDWNEFRKRAFAAGLVLTSDTADRSAGDWTNALADAAPNTFAVDGLSGRQALEQIVQAAEEAQDQGMNLSEYAMTLGGKEFVPEDDILDGLERQLDWKLKTFAEKADLEVSLRNEKAAAVKAARDKAAERVKKSGVRDTDAMEARIDERLQKKDAALARAKEKIIDASEARIDERLQRERAREAQRRALERQDRKDMAARQKARKELQELQKKTLKTLQWLNKNRYRAPEELREQFDEVLGDIDIYAVSAANELHWSEKYGATWRDLAQMYQNAKVNDPNFLPSKELERIVSRLDDRKIEDMDLDALNNLYQTAVDLRTEFYNRNRVLGDTEDQMFEEVYSDASRELREAGGYKQADVGLADKYFNDAQLTPMNRLERMAGWNPNSTWFGMAKQLEEGERAQRRFEAHAQRQVGEWLKAHQEWAKRSDGQGKDAIWYEIKFPQLAELGMGDAPIFGEEVTVWMTPAQKVQMYLESKNYDNLRHMAGGRTFPDKELYSKGKRMEAFAQGMTVKMAPETVKAIVSDLTAEEKELADVLDAFYNGYAKSEINRVSNILYGYDKAMGKNYAPIFTNSSFRKSEPGVFDVTAEGVGNLKTRQVSKNPSYNIGAYDAFERNVRQTARFVGMAIPARNWKTLMNWRGSTTSMRNTIETSWGSRANKFIDDLITELEAGKETEKTFGGKLLSQYIGGVFGANPGIVLKQAASFPLAAAYLDPKYMPNIAKALRVDDALIGAYTSELEYRLMGYATPATAQIKENPRKLQENKTWNFVFGGGAITAMDGWTVKSLWSWAANQVRAQQPYLDIGTPEQIRKGESAYYKEVAKLFEYAVSRSQPMYDVMHRSAAMRVSWAKPVTLFKTVPQQEYNMLRQAAGEAQWAKQHGTAEAQKTANRRTGRAVLGILAGNLMLGTITFLSNMLKTKGRRYRDKDGNLTVESVLKQAGQQYLSDTLGISLGGDILAESIGAVFAGGKFYDLTSPGVEQINEVVHLIVDTTSLVKQLVADSAEVIRDGGDWNQYMRDHSEVYLQSIRTLTKQLSTYIGAFPAENLEARLLGAVRWISPKLAAAYEDAFEKADRSGLKGLTGEALEQRVGSILSDWLGERDEESAKAIAALYADGFKNAVPGSVPDSISIDGETRKLGLVQQQTYENVWSDTVREPLKALVRADSFQSASDEQKEKMIARLYDYAGDTAKLVLFDDYTPDKWVANFKAFTDGGGTLPEALAAWAFASEAEGEKDLNGKTITNSRRRKIMNFIDGMDLSDTQKDLLLAASDSQFEKNMTEPWNGMNYEGIEEAVRTGKYGTQNERQYFNAIMKEGVEKQQLKAAITQMFKDEYLRADKQERAKLKGRLINAFMALGRSQAQAKSDIEAWEKAQKEKEKEAQK